jgi:two-component system NtrC family sensor kinase
VTELTPDGPVTPGLPEGEVDSLGSGRRYRRILLTAVLSVSFVAIVPLIIATGINYLQYQEAFREEQSRPMVRFAANGKLALEAFLEERTAALRFVSQTRSHQELTDPSTLGKILEDMKSSFGGFSDLGVIEGDGTQLSYAGPYELEGRDYGTAPWFREVIRQGIYVSEVFLGYRDFPHFVIASYRETGRGEGFVLRATIDTEYINRLVGSLLAQPGGDVFLVNHQGILQTPSRSHGGVLTPAQIPSLPFSIQTELLEIQEPDLGPRLAAYTQISGSPFVLAMVSPGGTVTPGWTGLRRNLLFFLGGSTILILAVVIWGSHWMVGRARDADMARAAVYHRMEYENKMAALGRLSAGVAHEINNPVAIISEKAGLLKDLLLLSESLPPKERMLDLLDSVLRSADRCGRITHRLLGFAKHMQVQTETIELDQLLVEVLGFLEKEATYRGIKIELDFPDEAPEIISDRGQLQQVFLNVINNAFAAVDEGGRIQIGIIEGEPGTISVWIQDNGVGIPEEHLSHIFDPFFTTKKGSGTGLGLSITYGIVKKLGGEVSVQSQVGVGTRFILTFPLGKSEN